MIRQSTSEANRLVEELNQARKQLASEKIRRIVQLFQYKTIEDDLSNVFSQIQELEKMNRTLAQDNQELKSSLDNNLQTGDAIHEKNSIIAQLQNENAKLEQSNETMLFNLKSMQDKLAQAEASIESLKSTTDQLTFENQNLSISNEHLTREIQTYDERIQHLTAEEVN